MQESPADLGPLDPETTDLIRVLSPGLPRRVRHPPVPAGIPRDKHGSAQRADLSGYAPWTTAKNASSARSSPSSSTKAKSSPGTASPLPLRPGRRIRAGVPRGGRRTVRRLAGHPHRPGAGTQRRALAGPQGLRGQHLTGTAVLNCATVDNRQTGLHWDYERTRDRLARRVRAADRCR